MRYSELLEAKISTPDDLAEACWWVQRYVTGSMRDPDWDWGEPTKLNINTAMDMVGQYVGNANSTGKPLSRYLQVSKKMAQQITETKILPANGKLIFQSFSAATPEQTVKIGREIAGMISKVEILVTATPSSSNVLFGLDDIHAARHKDNDISDLYEVWAQDWGHQKEVLVRVVGGLPLDSVQIIKN